MARGGRGCRYLEILPAVKRRLVLHTYPESACLMIISTLPHEFASQGVPSSLFRNSTTGIIAAFHPIREGASKRRRSLGKRLGEKGHKGYCFFTTREVEILVINHI